MLPEEVGEVLCRDSMKHISSGSSNGKYNADELCTDLKLLLECLKYHENNAEVLKDGLLTVSSICLQNAQAQDYFRDSGGLNFVLNLLTTNRHESIMESAMYTLGCATERNVFSQKRLCTKSVFRFLECKLVNKKAGSKLKRTVAYLLLCLVSNNSAAQTLMYTSRCLDALLDIFRSEFPGYNPSPRSHRFDKSANVDGSSLELWKAVTSTLIGCVNNPQNDTNQKECSSVFSVALNILSHTKDPQVIRVLASFLSLTADNNGRNQDRLGMLGGMDIIVTSLQTVVESLLQEPSPDCTDASMQVASLLVSCVTENSWNKITLADLRVVPLLVQLLALDVIETEVKLKIVLTLGQLTEGCEASQRQLVESDGLGLIVHTMTGQQDEEFNKAATYLLHTCVRVVNISDAMRLESGAEEMHQKPSAHPTLKTKYIDSSRRQSTPIKTHSNTKTASTNFRVETDEEESVTSITSKNNKAEEETSCIVDFQKDETGSQNKGQTENNCTTVEALFQEISARKELEVKLQKEVQARENVEAEKLQLEKREEKCVMVENVTKQKPEAIAKELERQYLITVNKEESQLIDAETPKKTSEPKLEASKFTQKDQVDFTSPSSREVQVLEKKVEELQKQLEEHITHDNDHQCVYNNTTSCTSMIATKSVESLSTIAAAKSPSSNSKSHIRKAESRKENQMTSVQNADERIHLKIDGNTSYQNATKSLTEEKIHGRKSTQTTEKRRTTPNIRHTTKPQFKESVFKLPSSTITRSQKTDNRSQNTSQPVNQIEENSFEREKPPNSRPTYADEVLPYKQQKYGSPLVLPKHHVTSSTSNDGEESELESIMTGLTDTYSVADSGVAWSDVLLKLPVRPRRSKAQYSRGRVRQHEVKTSSICSSQSRKSKRSFVVNYIDSQHKNKEATLVSPATPSSTKSSILKCPGCEPPVHRPLLTSRNFLYTLEKSGHTCPEHREIQKAIKQDIEKRKRLQERRIANQACKFSEERNPSACSYENKTPIKHQSSHANWASKISQIDMKREQESTPMSTKSTTKISDVCDRPRRKRQEFSQEEIDNLITGVQKSGKHWNFILWSYKFKPGRTAVDLKDKYRRMKAQIFPGVLSRSPTNGRCKRQITWN